MLLLPSPNITKHYLNTCALMIVVTMRKERADSGPLFKRMSELREMGLPGHMDPGHTPSQVNSVLISTLLSSTLKGKRL